MRVAILSGLLITIIPFTSVWAAQDADAKRLPAVKRVEHQRLMIGNRVVYEADVNVLDAEAKHYWIEIGIDDQTWRLSAADGSIGSAGMDSGGTPSDAWQVSYVVQEKKQSGLEQVDLVYTIRNAAKGVDRSEHVRADLKVGSRYETTTPQGAQVWLRLTYQ